MAWTSKGSAGTVIDGVTGGSSALSVTSTSTIVVEEAGSGLLPNTRLRMYLSTPNLRSGGGVILTRGCDVCTDTDAAPWTEGVETGQPIQYVHSSRVFATHAGVFGGKFDLDGGEAEQSIETCVLSVRRDQTWTTDTLEVDDAGALTVVTTSKTLDVIYKDPCVLELPDGYGWLMILSRYRSDADARADATPPSSVDKSAGDVVAWWSSTPEFEACTSVGPFLLVDSLNAWPDGTIRLWLGTASAALVGDQLLVYYVVEKNIVDASATPPIDSDLFGIDYEAALDTLGFSAGVAASSVSWPALWSAITEEIATPGTWTDESKWNQDESSTSGAIEGTPLGLIHVWISQTDGSVTAFEKIYDGDGDSGSVPKWADPAAVVCEGALSLYLAGVVSGSSTSVASVYPFGLRGPDGIHLTGSGHGLWRCRAVDGGFALSADGDVRTATFGVDFVVAALPVLGTFGVSPDQIVQGRDPDTLYLDPDPVQMPDGSWRVYAGTTVGATAYFAGDAEDGCATASDLGLVEATMLALDAAGVYPGPGILEDATRPGAVPAALSHTTTLSTPWR